LNWEKVGKSLAGVLVALVCAAALYLVFRHDPRLEAELTYQSLTYPSQFSERISQTNDALKYEQLYDHARSIAGAALSHDQLDKFVDLAQAPYRTLFAKPFEAGLVDHRTGLFITLRNTGEAPIRNVRIRLPVKGLVQVRDEAGNDNLLETATSTVEIPAIGAEAQARVWIYFDGDYSQIAQAGVRISHDGGEARVRVFESFAGIQASVARYATELVVALAWLLLTLLGLGYICLLQHRALAVKAKNAHGSTER